MGSITKRLGKFQAKVRKGPHKRSGLSKTFISRVEANKWIRDIESKLDKTDFIVKQNTTYPTLKGLINEYLSKVSKQKTSYELTFTNTSKYKSHSIELEKIGFKLNKNKWILVLD